MKPRRSNRPVTFTVMLILFITAVTLLPTSTHAQTSLSLGSVFPEGINESHSVQTFMDVVGYEFPNEFNIDYAGGPEAFPPGEMFGNVQSGVVDLANVTGVYYAGELPMAQAMVLPEMTPWEMRQNGIHDFFDEIHQRQGVKYLGRTYSGINYKCYLQDSIEEPEDLEGRSIRTSPVYRPMLEHFGADPVTTPPGEINTALERGVVEGFCWPEAGVVAFGWHESVDYVVNPGFMQVELSLLMNLDTWNSLSEEEQEKLNLAVRMMERQDHHFYQRQAARDRIVYEEVGLESIDLEGDAADRYVNAAYNSYWEMLRERANPEDVDRLQQLLREADSEIPLGWDD